MIVILLIWFYLAVTGFPLGAALMPPTSSRSSLAATLPLWIGLLAQALALQVLAIFAPLYPAALWVMPALATLAAIAQPRKVAALLTPMREGLVPAMVGVGALALAIAYITAAPILYYDTGLYHIQILRWLARDGLVPGLDLLHVRLGFPSDWFAIAAPFDAGPLEGRLAAAANGYVMLLIAVQAVFSWQKLFARRARPADLLLVAALSLLILQALWIDSGVSAAPDFPVAAVTILLAALLVEQGEIDHDPSRNEFARCAVIAFLAAMTVAIKSSAAPILLIAALFCCWRLRHAVGALVGMGALVAAVLVPTIYTGYVLNGCPAFPLTIGCLDLPWRLPQADMVGLQHAITQFARWYALPPQGTGAFDWILPYFIHSGNRVNPPLVVLAVLSIVGFAVLCIRQRGANRFDGWVFALGLCEFVFAMIEAPDTRFFIGAIAILFGETVSLAARPWIGNAAAPRRPGSSIATLAVLGAAGLVTVRIAIVDPVDARRWQLQTYGQTLPMDLHRSLAERWLLPAPLPVIDGVTRMSDGALYSLTEAVSGDVRYRKPSIGDQCWGAVIPCTPYVAAPLRLRRPDRGIDGGFVRADRS